MTQITLRLVRAEDADSLYPLLVDSPVTDTILWDGPESLETFRRDTAARAERAARGDIFAYTIIQAATGIPIGSASLRPDEAFFGADIGLYIGLPFWNRGYGAQTIAELVQIGFGDLGLEKIEADIFVGNWASRRIFEKNGFRLEGTIRSAVRKRGLARDEWRVGLTRRDWEAGIQVPVLATPNWIVHICYQVEWEAARRQGEYRPASLAREGFIHFSAPERALRSANRYYPAQSGLALLWVDTRLLTAALSWELVDDYRYPHLYGALNLDAVRHVSRLTPDQDGVFRALPAQPDRPAPDGVDA